MQDEKPSEFRVLEKLNIRIGNEESARTQEACDWLTSIIAPEFAFLRADPDKTIEDREAFCLRVKPADTPDPPRETKVESIQLHRERAVVACVVTFRGTKYHNLRLF